MHTSFHIYKYLTETDYIHKQKRFCNYNMQNLTCDLPKKNLNYQ